MMKQNKDLLHQHQAHDEYGNEIRPNIHSTVLARGVQSTPRGTSEEPEALILLRRTAAETPRDSVTGIHQVHISTCSSSHTQYSGSVFTTNWLSLSHTHFAHNMLNRRLVWHYICIFTFCFTLYKNCRYKYLYWKVITIFTAYISRFIYWTRYYFPPSSLLALCSALLPQHVKFISTRFITETRYSNRTPRYRTPHTHRYLHIKTVVTLLAFLYTWYLHFRFVFTSPKPLRRWGIRSQQWQHWDLHSQPSKLKFQVLTTELPSLCFTRSCPVLAPVFHSSLAFLQKSEQNLQYIHHSVGRALTRTKRSAHISPASLMHQLPVLSWISSPV